MNYNNDDKSAPPFRKGKFKDIVQPRKSRYTRASCTSDADTIDSLVVDMVQVFADVGIVIGGGVVRNIVKGLVKCGWIKTKKLEG